MILAHMQQTNFLENASPRNEGRHFVQHIACACGYVWRAFAYCHTKLPESWVSLNIIAWWSKTVVKSKCTRFLPPDRFRIPHVGHTSPLSTLRFYAGARCVSTRCRGTRRSRGRYRKINTFGNNYNQRDALQQKKMITKIDRQVLMLDSLTCSCR